MSLRARHKDAKLVRIRFAHQCLLSVSDIMPFILEICDVVILEKSRVYLAISVFSALKKLMSTHSVHVPFRSYI